MIKTINCSSNRLLHFFEFLQGLHFLMNLPYFLSQQLVLLYKILHFYLLFGSDSSIHRSQLCRRCSDFLLQFFQSLVQHIGRASFRSRGPVLQVKCQENGHDNDKQEWSKRYPSKEDLAIHIVARKSEKAVRAHRIVSKIMMR